jgi:hypothetical protein
MRVKKRTFGGPGLGCFTLMKNVPEKGQNVRECKQLDLGIIPVKLSLLK